MKYYVTNTLPLTTIKLCWAIVFVLFLITTSNAQAQNAKVNDPCNIDGDCASGKCLTLRSGKKVCATCTQDRLNTLSDRVDRACKDKDQVSGSVANQGEISMDLLQRNIAICKECIAARKEVLNDCFYGNPDRDHVDKVKEWETVYEYNVRVLNERTGNYTAYYCSKSDYENYQRYVESYCSKNFQQASEDAYRRKSEKGGCSELENWVKSCQDCVNNYNDFKKNCFRDRMSSKRQEELDRYNRYLKEIKDVLDSKKSNNLCN